MRFGGRSHVPAAQVIAAHQSSAVQPHEHDSAAPQWYAAYTYSRHEKSVAHQLGERDITCFLPLYSAVHRWNGRRTTVHLPLFPNYLFVRIGARERLRAISTPGIIQLVSARGIPVPIPHEEMEHLQRVVGARRAEPHPYFPAGKRVLIASGPFRGLSGVVVRRKGEYRLVVSIECIMRSFAVELETADVELLAS